MKPKLMILLAGFLLLSLPVAPPAEARFKALQSPRKLAAKSDFVAVLEPLKNQNTKDSPKVLGERRPDEDFQAINTRFLVHWVIKGQKPGPKEITVLHFAYVMHPTPPGEPGLVVVNGPDFIQFEIKASRSFASNETGERTTLWLAFLKRRPDGRFEAVTGQADAADAFVALKETAPFVRPGEETEFVTPVRPPGRKRRK